MTQTAIAAHVHQTLDAHGDFATQVTFNGELRHCFTQSFHLSFCQILHLGGGIHAGSNTNLLGASLTDAENCLQADNGMRMIGEYLPLQYGPYSFLKP